MQPVGKVGSWEECKSTLREIKAQRDELEQQDDASWVDPLLYRGHSNAAWQLETTIERTVKSAVLVLGYYRSIVKAKAHVEAFTDARWDIPEIDEYQRILEKRKPNEPESDMRVYAYMAYLRQHSFPSPLLDWSLSPYVAAFFAFRDAYDPGSTCAIYVFLEFAGQGKHHEGGEPLITGLGPNVGTHRRHFLQQSVYTYCMAPDEEQGAHYYASHEATLGHLRPGQDIMWKITIPASERRKALTELISMNITPFSLFGSEESLMETIALREFL